MKLCVNCGVNPIKYPKLGLCPTCYQYEHRTGNRRPKHLTERQYDLNQRVELDITDKPIVREMWFMGYSKTFLCRYWHIGPETLRGILGLDT